jgi:hypothetical protein
MFTIWPVQNGYKGGPPVAALCERRQSSNLEIAGGHSLRLRAIALALREPPLQGLQGKKHYTKLTS